MQLRAAALEWEIEEESALGETWARDAAGVWALEEALDTISTQVKL